MRIRGAPFRSRCWPVIAGCAPAGRAWSGPWDRRRSRCGRRRRGRSRARARSRRCSRSPCSARRAAAAASSGSTVGSAKIVDVVDAADGRDERRAVRGRRGSAAPAPSCRRTDASSLTATTRRSASARACEIADVADVQQVEAAVGERDRPPGGAISAATRSTSASREDRGVPIRFQAACGLAASSRRAALLSLPSTARSLAPAQLVGDTVAVPRFITTRPPA
jgi:hypothetical protein